MRKLNERSANRYGVAGECRRGPIRGMGYTEEEFQRPLIAVVNSWSEYNPGHVHLRTLAERVKQGIREAGGLPFEVMTSGICDGMVLKNPRYIELPSRNSIADEVELQVAYAIGVARPVSVFAETFGTGKLSDDVIADIVKKEFDLRPAAIIDTLGLRNPIYRATAAYGHFGREQFPWERTDRVEDLKKYLR